MPFNVAHKIHNSRRCCSSCSMLPSVGTVDSINERWVVGFRRRFGVAITTRELPEKSPAHLGRILPSRTSGWRLPEAWRGCEGRLKTSAGRL